MICNDRRWPEAWRCLALQGVELVLCGYNTAGWAPDLWGTRKHVTKEQAGDEALFHHRLVMQANSYMNSCFSISAARCGLDDGKFDLIGGSSIVGPEGHILAEAKGREDEVVIAEIDLEECQQGKSKVRFCTRVVFGAWTISDFGGRRLTLQGIAELRRMELSRSRQELSSLIY